MDETDLTPRARAILREAKAPWESAAEAISRLLIAAEREAAIDWHTPAILHAPKWTFRPFPFKDGYEPVCGDLRDGEAMVSPDSIKIGAHPTCIACHRALAQRIESG